MRRMLCVLLSDNPLSRRSRPTSRLLRSAFRCGLGGALDGMTREQIATQAAPRSDADTQLTVLPSGETVTISEGVVTAANWTCAN